MVSECWAMASLVMSRMELTKTFRSSMMLCILSASSPTVLKHLSNPTLPDCIQRTSGPIASIVAGPQPRPIVACASSKTPFSIASARFFTGINCTSGAIACKNSNRSNRASQGSLPGISTTTFRSGVHPAMSRTGSSDSRRPNLSTNSFGVRSA